MAEPIVWGQQTHVGSRNHVLDGGHIDNTWRKRLNDLSTVVMQAFAELLWTLVPLVLTWVVEVIQQHSTKMYKH